MLHLLTPALSQSFNGTQSRNTNCFASKSSWIDISKSYFLKSPSSQILKHVWQCQGYTNLINTNSISRIVSAWPNVLMLAARFNLPARFTRANVSTYPLKIGNACFVFFKLQIAVCLLPSTTRRGSVPRKRFYNWIQRTI
ncbi:hypothetical protein Plhal304r1_c029g0096591 [Plasmopara halstedii]